MARHINYEGLQKLKGFECVGGKPDLVAYKCPAGVWTIGFGHTGDVTPGQTITATQAEQLLRKDLAWAERAVELGVTVPLTDNQFAALVCFTFNVGEGAFKKSTLLKKLNKGDYESVPKELLKWNKAGGRVLKGLTTRRIQEGSLFTRGQAVVSSGASIDKPKNGKTEIAVGSGATASTITIGSAIDTLTPLSDNKWVAVALIVLTLAGVGVTLFGLWKNRNA